MEELTYWKLKARLAEIEINEINTINNLNKIRAEKNNLLKENGLEPNKLYSFNDKEFTLEEVKNGEQTTRRNNS